MYTKKDWTDTVLIFLVYYHHFVLFYHFLVRHNRILNTWHKVNKLYKLLE